MCALPEQVSLGPEAVSFGLSFERCACESFGLCVTMGLLLLLSSADSWQLHKGDGSLLSRMALSRRESISPSAKHKAAQQVRKQSLKQSNRSQIERHTLSEGIAVVDEFLCNTSGELMGNFFQTLTGREHTLCQGTTLVLTYNTIQYNKIHKDDKDHIFHIQYKRHTLKIQIPPVTTTQDCVSCPGAVTMMTT